MIERYKSMCASGRAGEEERNGDDGRDRRKPTLRNCNYRVRAIEKRCMQGERESATESERWSNIDYN